MVHLSADWACFLQSRQHPFITNRQYASNPPLVGDRITTTITVLLRYAGLSADCYGGVIDIRNCSKETFFDTAKNLIQNEKPNAATLAQLVPDKIIEKHDLFLPESIRLIALGSKFFDIDNAWEYLTKIVTDNLTDQV